MDELQKQNEETLKTDYARQFFLGRIKAIEELNKQYAGPAEFATFANADLSGSVEEIPEEYRKSIVSVPQRTIDAFTEEKAQKQTEEQVADANNRNSTSVYQAEDLAYKASVKDYPVDVQAAYTSMFIDTIESEYARGKMSAKYKQDVLLDHAKNVSSNVLGRYLTSKELKTEAKLELVRNFINGNTGNEAIDKYSSPAERIDYLGNVLGFVIRYDNYEESLRKEDERIRKENFETLYANAVDTVVNENLNLYEIQDLMKQLRVYAKGPEENQKVSELLNVAFPKDSSPLAVLEMEEAKKNGTFDTALVLKHVSMGTLVGADAKKYLREANEPLNVNLSTETAKMLIDVAKVNFANNPEQLALWTRAFTSRLKNNVLSDIDISKAADDAYKSMRPLTGETKVERVEEQLVEAQANGINKTKFNAILNNSIQGAMDAQGVDKERKLDLDGQKLAYMNMRTEMRKYIKEEKSKNRPVSIENQNGDIITDEDTIIDYWIAMARKQRGW